MKRTLSLSILAIFIVALAGLNSCNQLSNPNIANKLATKVNAEGSHSATINNSKMGNYQFLEMRNTAAGKNYFVAYHLDSIKQRTGTGSGNYWWSGTKWSVYRETGKLNSSNDLTYHVISDTACEFWTSVADVHAHFDTLITKSYDIGAKKGSFSVAAGWLIYTNKGSNDTVGRMSNVLMMSSPSDTIELIGMSSQEELDDW